MTQFGSPSREAAADAAAANALASGNASGERKPVGQAQEGATFAQHGRGQPLPAAARERLEPGFGHNFSTVRIHASGPASQAVAEAGARAIAHGNEIAFAPGEWNPESRKGRTLLAHELAHVVRQGEEGRAQPEAKDTKTPEAEMDDELAASTHDPKDLDPNSTEYARALGQYAFQQTHDANFDLLNEPKDAAQKAAWKRRFDKAGIAADRILGKSGPKVEQKESRASGIATDLATAGFVDRAMGLAAQLTETEAKGFVYDAALGRPEKLTADHLTTIAKFTVGRKDSLDDNPIVTKLRDESGSFAAQAGTAKVGAALKELIPAYAKDADFPEQLARIAFFAPTTRAEITRLLLEQKQGVLLEAVSNQPYFQEGAKVTLSDQTTVKATSGKDLAWAVANKQKVVVDDIVALGSAAGVDIKAPVKQDIATLKAWLEANTEKIGAAVAKLHPGDMAMAGALLTRIESAFMYHVDPDPAVHPDVPADPNGKLTKLVAGGPANDSQLEVDCDVLATYGVRTLLASGYTPVGYMAIVPTDTKRAKHAMAMVEKGGTYLLLSNMDNEVSAAKDKNAALTALRDFGIKEAYDATNPLEHYEIFYEDCDAKGTLPKSVANFDPAAKIGGLSK